MIAVQVFATADNADVLAGTDLDNMPLETDLLIFGASTQNDTTLTLTVPGLQAPLNAFPLKLRAGPEIRQNEDMVTAFRVAQNGHVVVNLDVVTAATVVLLFIAPDA